MDNSKDLNQLVRLTQTKITTATVIKRDVLCQAGMVFQHPNPFTRSINDNVTHGPRLDSIPRQPVDTLLSTLRKYAQQPYPERINQAWAAALVLMILVLSINILTRVWVQARRNRMQGK